MAGGEQQAARMRSEQPPTAGGAAPSGAPWAAANFSGSDLLERERRLGELRAASQALAPALAANESQLLDGFARDLQERLQALADPLLGAERLRDELAPLDADLGRYAAVLRARLDRIPLALGRGWLGGIAQSRRDAAMALLELLLEDEKRLAARVAVLLDLVMLLCSEERDGRRRVVRDPATLTPRLRSWAERSAAAATLDLSRAEQAFVQAARGCERGIPEAGVQAMEGYKAELGLAILAPSVLRAVVFYQATVWSRAAAAPDAAPVQAPAWPAALRPPDPSEIRWFTQAQPAPAAAAAAFPGARARPGERRPRLRAGALGLVALVLLSLAGAAWWRNAGDPVHLLSARELAGVSPKIASGYRDASGSGGLFVGTVKNEWSRLSSGERARDGRQIVARLARVGVREVLLFDESRRIALHHGVGLPLRIGP